jgi:hypothetical protein
MKVIQKILLFSLCLLIFSCDEENLVNVTSLQQTKWAGTLNESYIGSMDEPISSIIGIGLFFISDNEGRYSLKWENIDQATEDTFEYTIDGKVLTIKNGTKLNGNWLFIQSDKDQMILEKGTSGENAYKGTLTLTRTH